MFELESDIGTARDNLSTPIHNWYNFTAGFSNNLVEKIIKSDGLKFSDRIFDAFAGCGTTLVSAQQLGIPAAGNEGQEFMYEIIKAKINWQINMEIIHHYINEIIDYVNSNKSKYDWKANSNPLLHTLYPEKKLCELLLIRDYIVRSDLPEEIHLFLKLALSKTLHKVSDFKIHPYIVRTRRFDNYNDVIVTFSSIIHNMLTDLDSLELRENSSQVFHQDSRRMNINLETGSYTLCLTSPPYLNNLDYGEISKVHTHFYNITTSWNDITEKVRKSLVTSSTTYYQKSHFNIEKWKEEGLYQNVKGVGDSLIANSRIIEKISKNRSGKKSYHILLLYYFSDMYEVLKEIRRVIHKKGKVYMVIGDSAPYGVFIPTTKILADLGEAVGFNTQNHYVLRKRGGKWQSLKHRHNVELTENILVLN